MEQLPDVYYLETIEQMRALADDLRQQIIDLIEGEPRTVTQIGAALDIAPAKIHYHVRELERVGLVRLVETRERGGILEKYYRAVARGFLVSNDLLQRVGPDDLVAAGNDLMQSIAQSFVAAFARAVRRQPRVASGEPQGSAPSLPRAAYALTSHHLWLTVEEFEQIERQIREVLRPYEDRRAIADERQYTAVQMLYETPPVAEPDDDQAAATMASPVPPDSAQPRRSRSVTIGVYYCSRQDLERVIRERRMLDLTVVGVCIFDAHASADLIDRAIARFRHRGALYASPAVRDALRRKEQPGAS